MMKKYISATWLLLLLFGPHYLFAQTHTLQGLWGAFSNKDTLKLYFTDDSTVSLETLGNGNTWQFGIDVPVSLEGDHLQFTGHNMMPPFGPEDSNAIREFTFDGKITKDNILNGTVTTNRNTVFKSLSDVSLLSNPAIEQSDSNNGFNFSGDTSTRKPANIYLILTFAIVFLLSFIILNWYIKKLNGRIYSVPTRETGKPEEFFPMVRISRRSSFLWGHRVVILYENAIAAFKKRKSRSIALLHEAGSEKQLDTFKGIRRKKLVPKDEIKKITIYPGRFTRSFSFKIKTSKGSFRLTLPAHECRNFTRELAVKFFGKVHYATGNLFASTLAGIIVTGLAGVLIYEIPVSTWWQQVLIWIALLTCFAVLPFLFAWYDWYRIARQPVEKKKTSPDLSHRKPFRSNALAITLKLVAIASVIIWLLYSPKSIPWHYDAIFAGILLVLSIALAEKYTDKLRKEDPRQPILYLRSFLDDNETTLTPCSKLSSALGVDPPYYWLSEYGLEEGMRYRIGKFIIKYGYSFWPMRLIRLLFGKPLDTSEEQLANYFKKYGVVVAIGRPGEKFITPGASRMYVTNEEWQQTVINLLQESQIVLLQPSTTDGVWWEIDKVSKECRPENIILCMVNYRHHQEYFENFLERFKVINPGMKIPRSIGNENATTFITFDMDWKPIILDLKYYSKLRWPFTGNALNLEKTFKDFFDKKISR